MYLMRSSLVNSRCRCTSQHSRTVKAPTHHTMKTVRWRVELFSPYLSVQCCRLCIRAYHPCRSVHVCTPLEETAAAGLRQNIIQESRCTALLPMHCLAIQGSFCSALLRNKLHAKWHSISCAVLLGMAQSWRQGSPCTNVPCSTHSCE